MINDMKMDFMEMCMITTQIMTQWLNKDVTWDRLVVFSRYSGFLHK